MSTGVDLVLSCVVVVGRPHVSNKANVIDAARQVRPPVRNLNAALALFGESDLQRVDLREHRRELIPKGSRNLLVAGRCVSSDRLANSALRVQASSMAMGQAAGAAAALAVRTETDPVNIEMSELTELLEANGAIVPTHPDRRAT